MWLFTVALPMNVSPEACLSIAALGILAGQLPFTFAGIGARDVALVLLLSQYTSMETAAAVGILMLTRAFLPPLAALPFLRPYLATILGEATTWRNRLTNS